MMKRIGIAVVAFGVAAGGCSSRREEAEKKATGDSPGTGEKKSTGGIVSVDGSSTVFLISQAVGVAFRGQGDATVGESGTGGGFKKFCRGEIDVQGASRPIKESEIKACKDAGIEYIELPVAYDGLAVVVNKKADWVDHLTTAELKKMWEPAADDKVTSWSQIRDGWPDKPLKLFGAGTDSGTFDYFTEVINGKSKESRTDYNSSEDDNTLVQGVAGEPSGLGYFGFAYYVQNQDRLRVVPIDDGNDDNGKGPIEPNPKTIEDGTYAPLARPIFIYVSTRALEKDVVARFAEFYMEHAAEMAKEVGYVPLSDKTYELAKKRLTDKKTGTMFSGDEVGLTIDKRLEQGS